MPGSPLWNISQLRQAASNDGPPTGASRGKGEVERRADRRYPINAELAYRITNRRRVITSGCGRTIDISSRGLLFESQIPLPRGLRIEVSIIWPTLPAGSSRLELLAEGRTVRTQQNCTAVQIKRYSFRQQPAI